MFTYVSDVLDTSVTYRGAVTKAAVEASQLATPVEIVNDKKSVTEYVGAEGEEKAAVTYNYNFDGDQIKTVTSFTYVSDVLVSSQTYRNNTVTAVISAATMDVIKSQTYYVGNEGEEKALVTNNYNY